MRYLLALPEEERPEVVLLDDGFQHRYVQPSFTILLIDAQRELHDDELLPLGACASLLRHAIVPTASS